MAAARNGGGPRVGLVLSGGGARGAYEAGVLAYILDELPRHLGRPATFDIITGTSVGAVHACYVAATAHQQAPGAALAALWKSMSAESIYNLGVTDVLAAPLRALGYGVAAWAWGENGGGDGRRAGIFDTAPLERLVRGSIPWADIRRNVDAGRVGALAVAATEVATGRTVVFVDTASERVRAWPHDPFVEARPARIGPGHAIASAAIPFLFPLVRLDGTYFCDGGLRLNTPLAPALRLGADRVLVIALRGEQRASNGNGNGGQAVLRALREADCSRPTFLLGKVLNAFLLDPIDYDLDRLRLFNAILEQGRKAYGEEFLERINEPITALRGTPYRNVRSLCIRPSRNIGAIAFDCAEHRSWSNGLRALLTGAMVRYAARGAAGEGDLLSYLLFDHCFTSHLVELGRADAEARRDELLAFFSA
jgi:NTE family protein